MLISINKFKEAVVTWLIGEIPQPKFLRPVANFHYLASLPRNERKQRPARRCRWWKKKPAKEVDMCPTCKDQPALCIEPCFLLYHQQLGVARVFVESADDIDIE